MNLNQSISEWTVARFLERHRAEFLEDIKKLIRIPSISKPTDVGYYPFGEDCRQVLEASLEMGRNRGFETENHDYYCGSILMPGTGSGEIGIFAHLDVVPEGCGWLREPYCPVIEEGWLYGRGSADNKGPAVTALYAMTCLKESGTKLRRSVRLFLGCNEENGMRDITYYLERFPAPDFSFTPDASFSVCYSEKGILTADFICSLPEGLVSFTAGTASNAVAGSACALLSVASAAWGSPGKPDQTDLASWPGISLIREKGGLLRTEATGRSAHAAFPEGSVNAGAELAAFLCNSGLLSGEAQKVLSFPAECFREHYGEELGIGYESESLGKLTAICGIIRTEAGLLKLNINIRYPAEINAEEMIRKLAVKAENYGWQMEKVKNDPPSYVSPESPFVKALNKVCTEWLNSPFVPYTMGGGTYARRLPNAVAFGPGIRGLKKPGPEGHGGGHQPDECVQIKMLEDALHIYVQALLAIDKLEL